MVSTFFITELTIQKCTSEPHCGSTSFGSVQFTRTVFGLDFIRYYLLSSIIIFKVHTYGTETSQLRTVGKRLNLKQINKGGILVTKHFRDYL